MRGTIIIDDSLCKGCDLCIEVCPKKVIGRGDHFNARGYRPVMLFDPAGLCTGCLLCSTVCPDVAITVYRESKKRETSV